MKQPPRLPYRPRRWRGLRIALRVGLWTTLVVVAAVRFLGQWDAGRPGPMGFPMMDGGGRGWGHRRAVETKAPVSPLPGDLWRLTIEVSERDANRLRGHYWGGRGGNQEDRPEVMATVREGGEVYTNVSLHLKGAAGSFQPFDMKPAMTLNFSKHVSGRRFHDFAKISLNNSVQDDTFLCEKLCRELFVAAGVPVPQADHATVVLNGRDLGMYVVLEGWGKPFLRRHFSDVNGNLYDGGFVRDVDGALDINSGEDKDRTALARLAQAAQESNAGRRWERLTETLDVDRFATLMALDVLLCDWDGYGMNRNNYRVFHDRSTGRMVFMPHGMDQVFGTGGRMWPTGPIEPQMRGLVARAFLSVPPGRKLYYERMLSLRTNVFVEAQLTNRVMEMSARIRPTLAAYDPAWARRHDDRVRDLCERISARVASVTEQLTASPHEPVTFGADGVHRPSQWRSRLNTQGRGGTSPRFDLGKVDEMRILRVRAGNAGNSGSWRSRVLLGPGRYRFEGRVRGESGAETGGACLRVSGMVHSYQPLKGTDWVEMAYEFEVVEESREVELVCDVAAGTPGATFDRESLRVVRLGQGERVPSEVEVEVEVEPVEPGRF